MAKYKIINGEGIIPNGTTEFEDHTFGSCSELTSINIPESVTKIGEYAFNWCRALKSVTIPNSVTEIGEYAFSGCKTLTSINIPNSVTKIGYSAFSRCKTLTSIIVAEENKVYDSRGNCNAIIETKTNRLIQGCTNTVIPESVTEIGDHAFYACETMTSINIPNSVTKIGKSAFWWCEALISINIPESVTEIGAGAFSKCTALTSLNIPDSVTEIGRWAFDGCENLKEIILFQTDPSKIKVTESSGLQKTQITLYVPKEGVAAFQKDSFWSKCADIKPITDNMLK